MAAPSVDSSIEGAGQRMRLPRILDLSTVLAGPFATHLLADAGFDVIKVEAPDGDITRIVGRSPEPGMASIFQHINRNKRGVSLDLKSPQDKEALRGLIASADVFVHNMRPRAIERLGFDPASVMAIKPSIVYCAVVGFGSDGPYAGKAAYDDLIQGLSGIADLEGRTRGGVPAYVPMSMADRVVGLYAASAIQSALLRRAAGGGGCAIEVPMFECLAHFVLVEHMFYKSFRPAIGEAVNPRNVDPNRRPMKTRNGYLCLLPYSDAQWRRLFELMGRPDMRDDPRYTTFTGRLDNITELYGFLAAEVARRDTEEWLAIFEGADIPAARMNRIDDLLTDPHLQAVGFFPEADDRGLTAFRHMRSPVRWATGDDIPSPAPRLGEHSAEIFAEGPTEAGSDAARTRGG